MLGRHAGGRERFLKLRDVEPEYGHAEREGDGGEEIQVLRLLVEDGWVLEDTQPSGAHRQQDEPLPVIAVHRRICQYFGSSGVKRASGPKEVEKGGLEKGGGSSAYITTRLIK